MAVTGNEPVSVADLKLACSALIERIAALESARVPVQVWSGYSNPATFTDGKAGDIIVADVYEKNTSIGSGGKVVTVSALLTERGSMTGQNGLTVSRSGDTWSIDVSYTNWTMQRVLLISTQD